MKGYAKGIGVRLSQADPCQEKPGINRRSMQDIGSGFLELEYRQPSNRQPAFVD